MRDPIFFMIDRHREAGRAASDDSLAGMSDEDAKPYLDAQAEAFGELLDTPPVSLEGAIAFCDYLPDARTPGLQLDEFEAERALITLAAGIRIIRARTLAGSAS